MQIKLIRPFTRDAKPLLKKYRSLEKELDTLFTELEANPRQGTSLGRGCYKIRIKIASKGGGSRDGARVITCVVAVADVVYLLTIYDKAEQAAVSDQRLTDLLAELPTTP